MDTSQCRQQHKQAPSTTLTLIHPSQVKPQLLLLLSGPHVTGIMKGSSCCSACKPGPWETRNIQHQLHNIIRGPAAHHSHTQSTAIPFLFRKEKQPHWVSDIKADTNTASRKGKRSPTKSCCFSDCQAETASHCVHTDNLEKDLTATSDFLLPVQSSDYEQTFFSIESWKGFGWKRPWGSLFSQLFTSKCHTASSWAIIKTLLTSECEEYKKIKILVMQRLPDFTGCREQQHTGTFYFGTRLLYFKKKPPKLQTPGNSRTPSLY